MAFGEKRFDQFQYSGTSLLPGRETADLRRSVRLPGPHAGLDGDDRAVPPTHAGGRGAAQGAAQRGLSGDAGKLWHALVDGGQRGDLPVARDRDLSLVRAHRQATGNVRPVLTAHLACMPEPVWAC
jgi:hypothetical protein